MTQFEAMKIIIDKDVYHTLVEYKPLLEQYKIRRFGVDPTTREILAKIYEQVSGEYIDCKSCGSKLYLLVLLQWIYNYETNKDKKFSNVTETPKTETIIKKQKNTKDNGVRGNRSGGSGGNTGTRDSNTGKQKGKSKKL